MKRSLETWFAILNRQTNQLKKAGEGQPSKEARPLFENLIVHLKLGWTMFQDYPPAQTVSRDSIGHAHVLFDLREAEKCTTHIDNQRSPIAPQKPVVPQEPLLWWEKTTKYIDFAKYASGLIRASAKKHNVRMTKKSMLGLHHKTFLTLIGSDDKCLPALCSEESFALTIARNLNFSLKNSSAIRGNTLSHLLAALEKRLNEVV